MAQGFGLSDRMMQFAVAVFRFCRDLPKTEETLDIARQFRRAGSAVAANYRASRRGRSTADFVAKIGIVIEEADECAFWLEFLVEIEAVPRARTAMLAKEANELIAILMASKKTAIANRHRRSSA